MKEFSVDLLKDILFEDDENYTLKNNNIVDESRWENIYEVVFEEKETGKSYQFFYTQGKTEYQADGPQFDTNNNGLVECREVKLVEKIVYVYEVV